MKTKLVLQIIKRSSKIYVNPITETNLFLFFYLIKTLVIPIAIIRPKVNKMQNTSTRLLFVNIKEIFIIL